jgi:hypothetical protein
MLQMTETDMTDRPPSPRARGAGIVALYTVAGPMIGALAVTVLSTALAATAAEGDDLARSVVGGLIGGAVFAVILGYAVGLAPALALGLAVARAARGGQPVRWGAAMAAAAAIAAVLAVGALIAVPPAGRMAWIAALVVATLAAAAGCTALARRLFPGA